MKFVIMMIANITGNCNYIFIFYLYFILIFFRNRNYPANMYAALEKLSKLKQISISIDQFRDFRHFSTTFPYVRSLSIINIAYNYNLHNAPYFESSLRSLGELNSLKILHLEYIPEISVNTIKIFLDHFTHLQELHMKDCLFRCGLQMIMFYLNAAEHLRVLTLNIAVNVDDVDHIYQGIAEIVEKRKNHLPLTIYGLITEKPPKFTNNRLKIFIKNK